MTPTAIYRQAPVLLQTLFLINLLALPGIALLAMGYLCRRHWHDSDPVIVSHVRQVVASTLWFVLILTAVIVLFLVFGNGSPQHWTMLLLFAIVFHTTFVMIGMVGLAKAISGKPYHPYLIGAPRTKRKGINRLKA